MEDEKRERLLPVESGDADSCRAVPPTAPQMPNNESGTVSKFNTALITTVTHYDKTCIES